MEKVVYGYAHEQRLGYTNEQCSEKSRVDTIFYQSSDCVMLYAILPWAFDKILNTNQTSMVYGNITTFHFNSRLYWINQVRAAWALNGIPTTPVLDDANEIHNYIRHSIAVLCNCWTEMSTGVHQTVYCNSEINVHGSICTVNLPL